MPTIAVNPMRCRVWNLHVRLDENLTEESCRTEIESFERHGQLVPALGRRLRGSPDYDVELIYGARRLFVARHLNMPLLVEVRDVSDRDGIIAMDLENRLRQDVSAFERATSYDRWLREGHFKSQEEITSALRVSPPQLSRLLKLARLPTVVIEAFRSPTDICEVWGAELAALLKESAAQRRITQAARSIAAVSPRPPAAEIYKQLRFAGRADRIARAAERIIRNAQGDELFRAKQQRGSIVFNISLELLSQESLDALERAVARVMDPNLPDDFEMALDEDVDADADMEIEIGTEVDVEGQEEELQADTEEEAWA